MAGKVAEINQSAFDAEVRKADLPVLVDFWAPWCGPCRALAPILEQVADQYDGKIKVVKVNVDDNQQIAQEFNIMSIPTMILFQSGEVKDQIMGARPKDQIVAALEKNLAAV